MMNFVCFSASQAKKPNEVNQKPVISVDKENEIKKRREELAKQKEVRDQQIFINKNKFFYIQAENLVKKQQELIEKGVKASIQRDRERNRMLLSNSGAVRLFLSI